MHQKLEKLLRVVEGLEARLDEREGSVASDGWADAAPARSRNQEVVPTDARLTLLLRRANSFVRPRARKRDKATAWARERQQQHTRESQR